SSTVASAEMLPLSPHPGRSRATTFCSGLPASWEARMRGSQVVHEPAAPWRSRVAVSESAAAFGSTCATTSPSVVGTTTRVILAVARSNWLPALYRVLAAGVVFTSVIRSHASGGLGAAPRCAPLGKAVTA